MKLRKLRGGEALREIRVSSSLAATPNAVAIAGEALLFDTRPRDRYGAGRFLAGTETEIEGCGQPRVGETRGPINAAGDGRGWKGTSARRRLIKTPREFGVFLSPLIPFTSDAGPGGSFAYLSTLTSVDALE